MSDPQDGEATVHTSSSTHQASKQVSKQVRKPHAGLAIYTVAGSVMLVTSVFFAAPMAAWAAGTVMVARLSAAASRWATVPT